MQITVLPTIRPAQARFLSWLALAILLHAALLLAPIAEYGRKAGIANILEVTLQRPPPAPPQPDRADRAEPPPPPAQTPPAQPLTRPEPPPPELLPETAPEPGLEPPPPVAAHDRAPARPADLSAVRLLELARRSELVTPRPGDERRLGVFTPRPAPKNWQPGALPGEARFDGRALPNDVEIVDRWLAADGSHHVLVTTPTGEMLCGRAEAWDPMQPLVEKIMMFRTCGPDTATFEWPQHYRRTAPTAAGDAR